VVQPLFTTILRWIYEGELEDTYHEASSTWHLGYIQLRASDSALASDFARVINAQL